MEGSAAKSDRGMLFEVHVILVFLGEDKFEE
jgi:hypothetical protein